MGELPVTDHLAAVVDLIDLGLAEHLLQPARNEAVTLFGVSEQGGKRKQESSKQRRKTDHGEAADEERAGRPAFSQS
jgi:hypothetical protein